MRTQVGSAVVRKAHDYGLPLALGDVVITLAATLVVSYLTIAGRWVPGWKESALVFGGIAAGPVLFRALARRLRRLPGWQALDFAASFWLLPAASVGHCFYGPLVDAAQSRLFDRYLAAADLRLFGGHPSVFLDKHLGPLAMDVLLVCYYSYFFWPVMLALLLYFGGQRRIYEQYCLTLALCFSLNFLSYALVPAVGPRYFLADAFERPLADGYLTPYLDSLLRNTAFARDCFPSGHTAVTLVVLAYAFRYRRRFFWIMLPVAAGLVTATLAGRFHYGIDLICAVPLVIVVMKVAGSLCKARPQGLVVPMQALVSRAPSRA